MVDYQKLCIKLYNEITKTIESLEKVQEEVFSEFVESDPSRKEVRDFISCINLKSTNSFKINSLSKKE